MLLLWQSILNINQRLENVGARVVESLCKYFEWKGLDRLMWQLVTLQNAYRLSRGYKQHRPSNMLARCFWKMAGCVQNACDSNAGECLQLNADS